ncbi:MAG: PEP/pyruvate-binding domain-containing protein, partial [Planctomycetota bacterium]
MARLTNRVRVLALKARESLPPELIGNKAHGLLRLMELGFPVPPGFCVTTEAYNEHLRGGKLRELMDATLQDLPDASQETRRSRLAALQKHIIETPLGETLSQELGRHYQSLAAESVAVRSSGTAEDLPDATFAGLYESYLSIIQLSECLQAVKRCWASMW